MRWGVGWGGVGMLVDLGVLQYGVGGQDGGVASEGQESWAGLISVR